MANRKLRIELEPYGVPQDVIRRIGSLIQEHPLVRERLGGAESRLLAVQTTSSETRKRARARVEDRFRATLYDYTNDRTLLVTGAVESPDDVEVEEFGIQPLPSGEEFQEAVRILAQDERWGAGLRDERVVATAHVPPVIARELPDGRTRRTIGVVLAPRERGARFRVAAVDLFRREIFEIEPRGGTDGDCGSPSAGQPTVRNSSDQAWLSVWQGGTRLWRMLVRRPSASRGTNGSGIELQYVDYRGQRVLWQAHVPILNVKYDGDACGPYLDWQNEESPFEAIGSDPVPGFRLCASPAKTILESGTDAGNFTGVAVYVDGPEVVLVSEMLAGWYRYISQWRFHVDGTIKPRFGFTAVQYPCVCNRHHHHCYWRFDFDIGTPGNNIVSEFNDPPLASGWANWHEKTYEIARPRDFGRKRKWRVTNSTSGAGYEIVPGHHDGVATAMPDWPYPQGDVWIVRYKPVAELDGGVVATGPPYEANVSNFVNGELIRNQDVVVWYAGHFTHEVTAHAGHIVGPDLVPVRR